MRGMFHENITHSIQHHTVRALLDGLKNEFKRTSREEAML